MAMNRLKNSNYHEFFKCIYNVNNSVWLNMVNLNMKIVYHFNKIWN